jgi:membrane-bound serine protease (ClpP class)
MGLKAQRNKPATSDEGFMDEFGIAVDTLDPAGNVRIHGELWQAESVSGTIPAGSKVQVTSRKQFILYVQSVPN